MKRFWGEHIQGKIVLGMIPLILVVSCKANMSNTLRSRSSSSTTSTTVKTSQGYVLADNPIILSSNTSLSPTANLNGYKSVATITSESFLQGISGCYGLSYCFEVKANETQASDFQWNLGI
jgi:hypothetical protein